MKPSNDNTSSRISVGIQREVDDFVKKCLEIVEETTKEVESLDIPAIIDSYHVKVRHYCFTHRGSDNYLVYGTCMESECVYNDGYLNMTDVKEALSSGNDRYAEEEEEIVSSKYPDSSKWEEIAEKLEHDEKNKMKQFYQTEYNKDAHINYLVRLRIWYMTFNNKAKLERIKEDANATNNMKTLNFIRNAFKFAPDAFEAYVLESILLGILNTKD
ncbi:MAG: hypothetical protein IJR42_05215 [Paludibacteraceae bacterium]|nr:hypothetical protein [Paludibacteraceae bacterium]